MRSANVIVSVAAACAVMLLCSFSVTAGGTGGTVCPLPGGPDLIMGDLQSTTNYTVGSSDGVPVDALSVGITVCNIGDANAEYQAMPSNLHPVFAPGLFKLKDGRIEQIGMGWVLHGFAALAQNTCGCGCNGAGGSVIGIGCSNPHTSTITGGFPVLGPRWQVNAFTGSFPSGLPANPTASGTIARRINVKSTELEPSGPNVLFFAEYLLAAQQEASTGNQYNNASYRPLTITGGPNEFTTAVTGTTVREQSAIRAWKASDPSVVETDIQLPGEGLFILAAKATQISSNTWNYEYALYNMNSDLSCRAFRVPLPPGSVVTNVGFHDVDYHSGDAVDNFTDPDVNFSGVDWAVTITPTFIEWATETFVQNFNANALRWGTLYNFRFTINRAPTDDHAGTVGLTTYKIVSDVESASVSPAPSPCPADLAPDQPDGTVGVADLLGLINRWGPCTPGDYLADVTGDGSVGVADLLGLINAWGPCP